jgi:solute:Na+ symporter, SSS family
LQISHDERKGCAIKTLLRLTLLVLFAGGAHCADDRVASTNLVVTEAELRLPDLPSGAFVGNAGDALLAGGGLRADGSFSDIVYVREANTTNWQEIALRVPVAHAAAVPHEGKLYLVGGMDTNGVTARVVALSWTGLLEQVTLDDMPSPRIHCGASAMDGMLYVVGGQAATNGGAEATVFRFDPNATSRWEALPPIPGGARVRPTVLGFYSELHVFGGERAAACLSDAWGYREKPLDGTTTSGWRQMGDLPRPLAAAALCPTGQTHALFAGGVSGDAPSRSIYIFHNVTDTWVPQGELPEPLPAPTPVTVRGRTVLAQANSRTLWHVELAQNVKKLRLADYGVMIVYFCFMALIGVYFARKQNSSEEFALGNRNVKWWAAGVSMFATGASSISFMAIPAQAFRTNLVWFTAVLFAIPLFFLQAYVIYPILRRLNMTSTYEYLDRRFNKALRLVASGQCIAFQLLGRMSVVMLLPAWAISAVTGLNVFVSVALMGLLTTVYTALGGFEAVIWTDFSQGVLMMLGAGLMVVLAIGGLPGGMSEFIATGAEFGKFKLAIFEWDYTLPIFWIFGLGLLMQNLAFAGDQPVVQRVYATPLKDMRKLAGMFCFCSVAISLLVNFSGISIFAYFRANPEMMDPVMTNDQVVPLYIVQRFPVGFAGLIIAALFAASMSTLSSSMNSVATVVCEDFYRLFRPESTDRQRLVFMKVVSLLVGVVGTLTALYMAGKSIRSMFKTWNLVCALLGGGFIGIYILGMFTRRASGPGVIIGALTSIVATILVKQYSPLHWTFYAPVAVLSCLVVGYLASLCFPGHRKPLEGLTVFDMRERARED